MANIFEFLSKDGNITPEKARKSRKMQFHDKTAYVWMGILPLKKCVNRNKCSFATKQRMFGVFAIDEILCYRGTRFPGSRTLCHPGYYPFDGSMTARAPPVLKIRLPKPSWKDVFGVTKNMFFGPKCITSEISFPSGSKCHECFLWARPYYIAYWVFFGDLTRVFKVEYWSFHWQYLYLSKNYCAKFLRTVLHVMRDFVGKG